MAFAVLIFPINSAEDAIEVNQGQGGLLIRPGVSSTVEVDFLESKVVDDTVEAPHHVSVEVPIVLILVAIDKVEISA